MIVKKTCEITTEDINSVILELADEIKNGYKICKVECKPHSFVCDPRPPVVAEVVLLKENSKWLY